MCGEVGMLTGQKRGASMVADTDACVFRLTRLHFEQLKREDLSLYLFIRDLIFNYTVHRLKATNMAAHIYRAHS